MSDAYPMIARCVERQGIWHADRCACGEEKNPAYAWCPTCDLRDALRRAARRAEVEASLTSTSEGA